MKVSFFCHCHSQSYPFSLSFRLCIFMLTVFKISLLLLLSLITAFGQNKYGYWNGWHYSGLQCSKCCRFYLTVTRESCEKIVYFNFQTKLFVSSFSIAKNAEWTWTEFYWRTFHSETRVSSEDSRLILIQMDLFTVAIYSMYMNATCKFGTPPMTFFKWLLVDEPRGHWGNKNIVGYAMKIFLCKKKVSSESWPLFT